MSIPQMLDCLSRTMASTSAILPSIRWYGFGSFFLGTKHFGDVDLLIVCSDQKEAALAHDSCYELWSEWPVHLMVLTEREEFSTSFISKAGCVPLPEGIPSWRQ